MRKTPIFKLAAFTFWLHLMTLSATAQTITQNIGIKIHNPQAFNHWCKTFIPQTKVKISDTNPFIAQITADNQAIHQLLTCPYAQLLRRAYSEVSFDRRGSWLNKISVVHQKFPLLNGDGMFVSVKENPFDKTDIDFAGRMIDTAAIGAVVDNHATTMTSIIAGGGNSSPNALGVAWKAQLYSASFLSLLPDNGTTLTNNKVYVQNHSYGVGFIENKYGNEAKAYDQQGIDFPQLLHVFSIGNVGNQADTTTGATYQGITGFANMTGQFKTSKNTLSVGEIDTSAVVTLFSSRGPAYDGRIKPELVAYGGSGTSETAALVSGISLLVQQAYQTKHGQIPPAALVKSLLINSADDLGRAAVDFEYGFGSVDALGAINSIEQSRFATETLTQTNDVKTFKITVPANAKHLKVTLVWHDPAAAINNTKALVNDLDLTVTKTSGGTTWKPWVLNTFAHKDSLQLAASRGDDHLNNVEQVTLSFPEAGEYEISVKAFALSVNNQSFSVVYEYPEGFEWIFPLKEDILQASRTRRLQWEWNKAAEAGKLEYKYTTSNTWQTIANISDLSQQNYHWSIPDTFALAQIRLTSNSGFSYTSDTLTIMSNFSPSVGYDCTDELMLFWSPLPGISSYQVYKMGNQYLEPLTTVTDTLIIIDKNTNPGRHFAVAPIIGTTATRLGSTINVDFKGVACYFKSFLLKGTLQDTVNLGLSLATNYRLAKIELQRRGSENQTYSTIENINPATTAYTLSDPSPLAYRNMYRILLTDVTGKTFASEELSTIVVAQNEFFMYPNPARINENLTVTDRRGVIDKIRVLNLAGKVLQEYTPNGVEQKEIFTDGLIAGMYLVQFVLTDGSRETKRLMIK